MRNIKEKPNFNRTLNFKSLIKYNNNNNNKD